MMTVMPTCMTLQTLTYPVLGTPQLIALTFCLASGTNAHEAVHVKASTSASNKDWNLSFKAHPSVRKGLGTRDHRSYYLIKKYTLQKNRQDQQVGQRGSKKNGMEAHPGPNLEDLGTGTYSLEKGPSSRPW